MLDVKKFKNKYDKKLCVFVSSPNECSDLFALFYKCFKTFWPDCPYEFFLVTNDQKYPDLTVINNYITGDTWMDRALPVLKQIKYDYVLILFDDFFVCDNVATSRVDEVVHEMEKNNIVSCRLDAIGDTKRLPNTKEIATLHTKTRYANGLVGIFKRKYLIDELESGCKSIWDLENKWMRDALGMDGFFTNIAGCPNPLIKYIHGVEKGRWVPSALNKLREIGIEVNSSRGKISQKEVFKRCIGARLGQLCPRVIRRPTKLILGKLGWHFVTDN